MLFKLIQSALQRRRGSPAARETAVALYQRGDLAAAAERFRELAAAAPGDPTAWSDLAATLVRLEAYEAAIPVLEHLLELAPALAEAHLDLGVCCARLKSHGAAVAHYRQAIALKPALDSAHANLLDAHLESCDWNAVARWMADFDACRAGQPVARWAARIEPFCALVLCPPELNRELAAERARALSARHPALPPAAPRSHGKIRIGYVSADFHTHATAHLTLGLYAVHDRSDFEVHAYSTGPDDGSAYRRHIAQSCDRFVDVRGETPQRTAQRIREDEIDILVDMKGYTANARPEIFARRPAPLQVAYLGYPGTTGAPYIDYFVTDRIATPAGSEHHFTEQLAFLPDTYQVNDNRQPVAGASERRSDHGLPAQGFVFCSFNRLGKIDRAIFRTWMTILQRVPGSVLWLVRDGDDAVANLRREAAAAEVDPARLVFAEKVDRARHLARHRLADLFLDTHACNAHTGASDALWAGLPLVTCPGTSFVSRVAASVLHAAGLSELVARDLDHYAGLAVSLANDRAALAGFKAHLEARRMSCALFDTPRYVRHLEAAYRAMHRRHAQGLPPASFSV